MALLRYKACLPVTGGVMGKTGFMPYEVRRLISFYGVIKQCCTSLELSNSTVSLYCVSSTESCLITRALAFLSSRSCILSVTSRP